MKKLVSIVLPTYNGEQWLRQAVESVLSQTYKELELICVNDASVDATASILEGFSQKDNRVKVITNKTNQKLPQSLNIGFAQAKGEYFTWTSDDNWYEPEAIEKMVNYLEKNPQDGMVMCDYKWINNATGCNSIIHLLPDPVDILIRNSVGACFLYRREIAQKVGGYDPNKFLVEDWDYWLRLRLCAPIGKLDECLYNYRFHAKSLTVKKQDQIESASVQLRQQMLPLYQNLFPNIDFTQVKGTIDLWNFFLRRDETSFSEALKTNNKREIFRALRRKYKNSGDLYFKQQIKKLGLKYHLKSMFIKKGTPKVYDPNSAVQLAKKWIACWTVEDKGIAVCSGRHPQIYPEVTGYYIPTLLRYGDKERAIQFGNYLLSIQNEDGSWSEPGGHTKYTFDTGMILKGLVALIENDHDLDGKYRTSAVKGANWICSMQREDGSIATPCYSQWGLPYGKKVPESIHVYCLEPLRKLSVITQDNKYEESVTKALRFYLAKSDLTDFTTLSHFNAYIIEGLIDIGETNRAARAMDLIALHQREDGSIPAYSFVDFVCSTGLLQYAICWYKLGNKERGNSALRFALSLQNRSGGFFGSYSVARDKANYFPENEISWAVKYCLDAIYYKEK